MFIVTRDQDHIPSSDKSETAILSPINGLRLGGLTLIYEYFVPPGLFSEVLIRLWILNDRTRRLSDLLDDGHTVSLAVTESCLLDMETNKWSKEA